MFELCIDTVGPFPRDDEGFIYIVVIIDNFTRYVTLHRCVDTTARAAGTAVLDHCCIYDVQKVIHTNNGSQYVNALISTLTKLFNVKHNLSIAYSSQENERVYVGEGICERVNREVDRHLQMLTVGQDRTAMWSFLPLVQRIINASEHSMASGYSPSQLMFGDSVDHIGLFPTNVDDLIEPTTDIDEWIHELIVKQAAMFEVARTQQAEINKTNIANRITARGDRELTSYAPKTCVLVKYPHSTYGRGPPTKLLPFWRGPIKVEGREQVLFAESSDREGG
jgi:hypothetical protein